jgi:hypothetical protein
MHAPRSPGPMPSQLTSIAAPSHAQERPRSHPSAHPPPYL